MQLVKVGSKGQVSIPRNILVRLGIRGETTMLVEVSEDGAIMLRPAAVYPLEIYSDDRLREFEESDRLSPQDQHDLTAVEKRKR